MKTKVYKSILLLSFLLFVVITEAQKSQPSPQIPESVQWLKKFNGLWQANMTSTMADKKYQFNYTVKCWPVAGGNGYYMEETGKEPTLGEMKGADLMGYDPTDGKLHCYSVDNMGSLMNYTCEWKAPDHLYMESNTMKDGKPCLSTLDMIFKDDNTMDFSMSMMMDGQTQASGSGTFHKVVK
jgi:hypothetical protein